MSSASPLEAVWDEVDVEKPPTGSLPWSSDPRGSDKTRIWQYLLHSPSGAPLSQIVSHLFDADPDDDDQAYKRELKFTRRFTENCPLFKIDRQQPVTRAEPRPAAFHLTSPKQHSNTDAVGRSDDCAAPEELDSPSISQSPVESTLNQFPREFARNFISSSGLTEMTDSRAKVLEQQFANYLEQIDDRYNILKNTRDEKPEYLLIPYRTLYNSEERVDDNWRRYHGAWKEATKNYSRAVQITLTTDPKRFESLDAMAEATSENFNRFMSWVRRRLADRCDNLGTEGHDLRTCPDCEEYGDRPDYIRALEWTDAGRPHLHVILFGINWLAPQHEISEQWGRYQASVVDVRSVRRQPVRSDGIEVDDRQFAWFSSGNDDGAQKNEKAHMGKYLGEQMPATESLSTIRERVEDEDDDLWKTAMFWSTRRRFWTCSEELKLSDCDQDSQLEDLPQYVWIGAAKSPDIPRHVWQSAVIMRKGPPPPGDDS